MRRVSNWRLLWKLVWRDFRFHRVRSALLVFTIALVTALYCFCFLMGGSLQRGRADRYQQLSGARNDIQFYHINSAQAALLSADGNVKSSSAVRNFGELLSPGFGYRAVRLAPANESWAALTGAEPTTGRLPQAANEIALDAMTLRHLQVPQRLGETVRIEWVPYDSDETKTAEFVLCGFWENAYSSIETTAWVTGEAAADMCPGYDAPEAANLMLGILVHQRRNLEEQAAQMLADAGLGDILFNSNMAFDPTLKRYAREAASPYYNVAVPVAMCGFLMLFSMLRVAAAQSVPFYVQVKALGMAPHHLRRMLLLQNTALCVPGALLGLPLGFGLYYAAANYIIVSVEPYPALEYLALWPFFVAPILAWATVLAASRVSVGGIARRTPAATAALHNRAQTRGRTRRYRPSTLPRLAARGALRGTPAALLSLTALALSATLLCVGWIEYVSYDVDKYLEGELMADYVVGDASAWGDQFRYKHTSRSITPQAVQDIAAHPAVRELGVVKNHQIQLRASDAMYQNVTALYESDNSDGVPITTQIQGNEALTDCYARFVDTGGDYTGIVAGAEPFVLDALLSSEPVLTGEYDAELFATGQYVVVMNNYIREKGAANYTPTVPVGETVTLGGQEFTVLLEMCDNGLMVGGANSPEAELSYTYFLPTGVFDSLYPDAGIRQVAVNIDRSRSAEFEAFLNEYIESYPYDIWVTSYTDRQTVFNQARLTAVMETVVNAVVLLLASLVHYGTIQVGFSMGRRRELAVYESLGMAAGYQRRLLLLQGVLQAAVQLAVLTPLVGVATWFASWRVVGGLPSWNVTYHFSLTPYWLAAALLVAMALLIPQICLAMIRKTPVQERLQAAE